MRQKTKADPEELNAFNMAFSRIRPLARRLDNSFNKVKGSPPAGDMALDNAVYVPVNGARADFIAGVRQGRFMTFDSSSGSLLTAATFLPTGLNRSSITYNSIRDTILISARQPLALNGATNPGVGVYPVNPTNLSIGPVIAVDNYGGTLIPQGAADVTTIAGSSKIAFADYVGTFLKAGIYDLNAATLITCQLDTSPLAESYQAEWDAANQYLWLGFPDWVGLFVWDGKTLNQFSPYNFTIVNFPVGPHAYPYGICKCPDNNSIYCVTASQTVYQFQIPANLLPAASNNDTNLPLQFSSFSLGRANATPTRIRYNPTDHLIYAPGWADGSVSVIDPNNSNAVAWKLGFDCPVDCVFTPTKKWAVLQGAAGLAQII